MNAAFRYHIERWIKTTRAGTITIDSAAIPNLKMTAMTMVFKIDPAMLKGVKEGDAIKCSADKVNGETTVTEIEKAK